MTGELAPAENQPADVDNAISGGTFHGPVIQGRDITDVDIDVTVRAAAAAPVALAQLPAATAGFTGRGDELGVLAGLLDPAGAGGPVVVSAVAGLAGVGKTTLAVQAGHAAVGRGWFPGGVLFVDLHGYDQPVEPAQALDGLLRALGVPAEHIPPGAEERAGLYRSVLAQITRPVLVVADNASTEAQVRPLLPGAGPHKVLVTSRYTLAGLGARLIDVTVLDDDTAMELLDTALRAARPEDSRITGDREAAGRLARTCDGLPLALQIVAALLNADPALSAAELAGELAVEQDRLDRLAYDDGTVPSERSVAAAFELSYHRLDDTAQWVYRLLPASPGPDVSTAAAAVLADLPVSQARRVLAELARAHLIEAAPVTGDRWRMHDLVRLYAQRLGDEYAEADRRKEARDRLLSWYLVMADAADDHLQTPPAPTAPEVFITRDDALNWLDTERANLAAVVKMAEDTGRNEIARRLPIALARYFNWRRRFDDLLVASHISLNASRRLGDRRREGVALNNLGAALREMRRFDEAIIACQDAAAIYREIADRHGEADALNNLGSALHEVRRFDMAITAHLQDLAICKEIGDRHGEADALNNIGLALREVRRLDEAINAHKEAASIYRETGDRHGEGITLNNLGVAIPRVWPQVNEAIGTLRRAAAIFQETGDRHSEGGALDNLGAALREAWWVPDDASAAHQEAASIFRETGDRHAEGRALSNLGLTLTKMRNFDEAIATLRRAAAIFHYTGDRHAEGSTLNNLSAALIEMRRFDEAIVMHQNTVAIFRQTGDRHAEGSALENLGVALREVERFQTAIAVLQNAASIFRETGDRHAEGSALNNLGQRLVKMRRYNEAIAAFERATVLYEEVGDLSAELEARRNAEEARAARQAFG